MLARQGEAFDSDAHLFEPKWDGFRALAFVEASGVRVVSRRRNDFTPRYPETDVLRALPPGTLVDGELVCVREGRVDFEAMLQREQARGLRIQTLAGMLPVTFVAFDLLYHAADPLLGEPLAERRKRLEGLVAHVDDPRLLLSEGVIGPGRAFFEETRRLGIEGMVAKELASPYEPGQRSGAWTKVKKGERIPCVIIGYARDDEGGMRSLIVASDQRDGTLRYVGRVGSGLSEILRARLQARLDTLRRSEPIVACDYDGVWVEPTLFCLVKFQDWTSSGTMRAPVFERLSEGLTEGDTAGEV